MTEEGREELRLPIDYDNMMFKLVEQGVAINANVSPCFRFVLLYLDFHYSRCNACPQFLGPN